MDMEAGLDTGPMRAKHVTPIEDKTAGVLTAELARAGAGLMLEVLEDLDAQPPVPPPEEGVTYAAKIEKAEARIDFTHDANFIERQIRDRKSGVQGQGVSARVHLGGRRYIPTNTQ